MTRIEGASAPLVSEFDLYQELLARIEHQNERGAREEHRAERDRARTLGEAAVAEMRTKADLRLAAAVVSAGVRIGSAASSAAGTAATASRSEGELPLGDGSAGAAGSPGTRSVDYGDHASAVNGIAEGLGTAVSGLLGHLEAEAEMRSERLRTAAEETRVRGEEARAEAEAAARAADKLTDLSAQALMEKRRAEEAASRA